MVKTNYKYYPMHMHLHASCDRGSSMALDMYIASKLGMNYIWFTDHDTRMGLTKNHITNFSFAHGLMKTDGKTCEGFEAINEQSDLTVDTKEKTLTINSGASDTEWTSSGVYFASNGKRHTFSLASDLEIAVDLKEFTPSDNTRLIFAVKLSQRPPEAREAYLLYTIGNTDDLEGAYNRIIKLNQTSGRITMNLSDDALYGDIGGKDNAFDTLYIVLQTKNGAKSCAKVSGFEINRSKICEDLRQSLQIEADKAGEKYKVKPFVAYEISGAGEHKNCFSTKVPVIEYHNQNYSVSEAEAIEHTKKHGGIFAINHPFVTAYTKKLAKEIGVFSPEVMNSLLDHTYSELANSNALGATLMEVGFPEGRVLPLEYYIRLWDMLALEGIFLSGYGASDSHTFDDGKGWYEGNNFAAYIGVDERHVYPISEEYFTDAMKKGRMYTADPTKIKGRICFETETGAQMGCVIVNKDSINIKFKAESVKPGWTFKLVENGKTVDIVKIGETEFEYKGKLSLNDNKVAFCRTEIYDEKGRCILLTNPVYMVNHKFAEEHAEDIRFIERKCEI